MKHLHKKTISRAVACGAFLGCLLAPAAFAAQPNSDNVVRLPHCKKKGGAIAFDISTGTTNGVSNANGTLDPKWQLNGAPSGTGFATPVPVYSMPPYAGFWDSPIPPATWVSPWQSGTFGSTAVSGVYHYLVTFHVPVGYTNIHVQGQCRADDEGIVSLDNTQTMTTPYCHLLHSDPPGTFNFTGTTGLNHLRVRVQNGPPDSHTTGDPTGLMVQATVTAICERARD